MIYYILYIIYHILYIIYIYIYGRCDFIMGDSTGRAHQKVVVKPGNPELNRAARFTFFACMI